MVDKRNSKLELYEHLERRAPNDTIFTIVVKSSSTIARIQIWFSLISKRAGETLVGASSLCAL